MHITACSCRIDMLSRRTESPSKVTCACGPTHRRLLGGQICGQVKLAAGALLAQVDHALKLVVCTEAPAALVGVVECWSLHITILTLMTGQSTAFKAGTMMAPGFRVIRGQHTFRIPCTCKPRWSGYEIIDA